ncbi:MAG TPA: macro domain-containing protein [Solirubrobacterales bacterium]|nr:macro domain-containing protein [Solirubrobacterales bacterium]
MGSFIRNLGEAIACYWERWSARYWEPWNNWFHGWRWGRAEPGLVNELTSYRIPIQVCPRGCGYSEPARQNLLARTSFWGRVETRVIATFETTNCPECGAQLTRECARCKNVTYAPVVERCQFCGLPQPWAAERRVAAERANIRKWRKGEEGAHDPALELFDTGRKRDLWVIEGDITRLNVDAVVSNVDVDGQMWAEVASTIRNAAGEEVERLAQDGRPYKLGEAWMTAAGEMAPTLEGIIHVASMNRRGESSLDTVRECLSSAMDVATKEKWESVGIGPFGSGPNAIDREEWLQVFINTTVAYLAGEGEEPLSVVLVLFEPQDFDEDYYFLLQAAKSVGALLAPAGSA